MPPNNKFNLSQLEGVNVPRRAYFQQIGYEPHSSTQWNVHESPARFKVTVCGRRWGKSTWSGHELSWNVYNPANAGNVYWIVGPTYELGEREFEVVWDDIMIKLGLMNYPGVKGSYSVSSGNMSIEMPWGTFVKVASADKPKSLLGKGLSGVIMSEPASHDESTWDKYIRPALADKRGWGHFPGTPEGYNWLYKLYGYGQDSTQKSWASWKTPSWTNPIVYPAGREDEEIKEIERNASKQWFDQEIGAEFTTFEGQIYPEFSLEHHVKLIDEMPYVPEFKNFWAIDFGWSADWICLDIMVDSMDNVYVWREYVQHYKSTYSCGEELRYQRGNPEDYRVAGVFCDPNDPGEKETLELAIGMQVFAEKGDWSRDVEEIKRKLKLQNDPDSTPKPKFYVREDCPVLIDQLTRLQARKATKEKNPRPGQKDFYDHGPDALRYFFHHYFVLGYGGQLRDAYRVESNGGYTPTKKASLTDFVLDDGFTLGKGNTLSKMEF